MRRFDLDSGKTGSLNSKPGKTRHVGKIWHPGKSKLIESGDDTSNAIDDGMLLDQLKGAPDLASHSSMVIQNKESQSQESAYKDNDRHPHCWTKVYFFQANHEYQQSNTKQ